MKGGYKILKGQALIWCRWFKGQKKIVFSRVVLRYNLVARSYSLLGPAFESMLLKSVHLARQVNLVSTHLLAYYSHIEKECNVTGIKHNNANPL